MKKLIAWLDSRTGIREIAHEALYENIPSGARLRYVTGSMLVFAFVTQLITGVILWMAYSPSSQTAWESVYYIQHVMAGGWFLRGVHHYMAQAMIVLLGLHMLQVIVDKAYKGPREVNFWLGLILMQLILGLSLTGYLLPWDQKGYWATNVATNLMALVPFGIGEKLQSVVIGGSDYGHHTLTRFFAMHGGVLPLLTLAFLGMHIAAFRKHGITARVTPGRRDQYFWPHQVLWDGIGCVALVITVVLLTIHFDIVGLFQGNLSGETHGADLGAPADASEPYGAARPEWYFLFLFQFLKFFHGRLEIVGAIIIPGAVVGFLFLMPFVGKVKHGHVFNVVFILVLLGGAGGLTGLALYEDANNETFQKDKAEAEKNAERIHELAQRTTLDDKGNRTDALMFETSGLDLLKSDPLTQGPKLFRRHCASCHQYEDPDADADENFVHYFLPQVKPHESGQEAHEAEVVRDEGGKVLYHDPPATAPGLYGFASREWIRGLLDPAKISELEILDPEHSDKEKVTDNEEHPDHHRKRIVAPYFGNTMHKDGRMVDWVQKHLGDEAWMNANFGETEEAQEEALDAIVLALSAQARLPAQATEDADAQDQIAAGVGLIKQHCASCHRFGESGQLGLAPDLTGYGSYEWMMGIVSDPTHDRFYRRENDRMPSFAKDLEAQENNTASIHDLSLIVDWIRRDYYSMGDAIPRLPHSKDEAHETVHMALPQQLVPAVIGETVDESAAELAQAKHVFTLNCSSCHNYLDDNGAGMQSKNPSAPNLHQFASRKWLSGLLDIDQFESPRYFGKTAHAGGDMLQFLTDAELNEDEIEKIAAALSAQAKLASQAEADTADAQLISDGMDLMVNGAGGSGQSCIECHTLNGEGEQDAPTLTNYGSAEWLAGMISDAGHSDYYFKSNDRMPRFRQPANSKKPSMLSKEELQLLIKLLRGELD